MQEQHHNVYDATSRSVQLGDIPSSLHETDVAQSIVREDLPVDGARVFVLRNFFTPEECEFFITSTEGIGYDKHSDLAAEYPPEYRNNQRLIVISPELGDSVWNRLQPQLQFKDVHNITPIGYATEGLWLPSSVNTGFLFGRYKPGQYFKPHYDGMYKNSNGEVSIYTVTVYLNDNYEGGSVKFMRSREDPTVLYTYKPKQGDALIFNHDVYHEGETLETNSKYLARTCLMFRRMSDLSDPNKPWENDPVWQQMRDDFAKFDEILDEKDPKKFAETYLRLQSIQLKHARSIKPDLHSILPLEIIVAIFMQLDLQSLSRCFRVCKAWHSLSIHGAVWREMYKKEWGTNAVLTIEGVKSITSPDIVNWQEKFCQRLAMTAEFSEKIVCFPGEYFYAKKGKNTAQFLAAVMPRLYPWDNSFAGYQLSKDEDAQYEGIRYCAGRGLVGFNDTPIGYMFDLARDMTCEASQPRIGEHVLMVTNRLAWGEVRDPDYVIGSGVTEPKTLPTLESFNLSAPEGYRYKLLRFQHPLDPAITCTSEHNAYCVYSAFMYHYMSSLSFVDRSLVLAYSKSCRHVLVISEEHELSHMPAQLTVTPVIDYKIVREHEKLVEIYYGTPNDGEHVTKFVATLREIINEIGGAHKIGAKILFSREEKTASESFLFVHGDKLEISLKSQGFHVIQTVIEDVLEGAEIFGLSEFYDKSVAFVND